MPSEELTIARKQVGDMLIASICFQKAQGRIDKTIEKLFQHCAGYVCGPSFTLYHNAVPQRDYDAESCVPVTRAVETDEIKSRILAGGIMLYLIHRGPHSTLGEAWEMLFDHIERHNIAVNGPVREIYLEGYEEYPDSSTEYLTELQAPLK